MPLTCTHKDCIENLLASENKTRKNEHRTSLDIQRYPDFSNKRRESLGNPTGIQDIESLNEWFSYMKTQHKDDNVEFVYKVCAKELIRQVSVHCTLRGKVLKQVLTFYWKIVSQ